MKSTRALSTDPRHSLNAICPYFTMFPLEYPMRILKNHSASRVLDPFCGRGTTLYASRFLGIDCWGLDTSPVAVAIARAKLSNASPTDSLKLAKKLLENVAPTEIPNGLFWKWAFHKTTLTEVCALREGLQNINTEAAALLRAVCMGALHGPRQLFTKGYFSNQFPRTFAPKPKYSLRYLRERNLKPEYISAIDVIQHRLSRLTMSSLSKSGGIRQVIHGDSGVSNNYKKIPEGIDLIITSPPYYGMNTYIQDQWLRNWFLGAGADIDYVNDHQITHNSPEAFISGLSSVWKNCASLAAPHAKLFIRFGAINDRPVDIKNILIESLNRSGHWRISNVRDAKSAHEGKRQATQMGNRQKKARVEYDFVAKFIKNNSIQC
jgi:hypothetical protein